MEETWNTDITINTEAMAEKILICSISHIKWLTTIGTQKMGERK